MTRGTKGVTRKGAAALLFMMATLSGCMAAPAGIEGDVSSSSEALSCELLNDRLNEITDFSDDDYRQTYRAGLAGCAPFAATERQRLNDERDAITGDLNFCLNACGDLKTLEDREGCRRGCGLSSAPAYEANERERRQIEQNYQGCVEQWSWGLTAAGSAVRRTTGLANQLNGIRQIFSYDFDTAAQCLIGPQGCAPGKDGNRTFEVCIVQPIRRGAEVRERACATYVQGRNGAVSQIGSTQASQVTRSAYPNLLDSSIIGINCGAASNAPAPAR